MNDVDEITELLDVLGKEPNLDEDIILKGLADHIRAAEGKDIRDIPAEEVHSRYTVGMDVGVVLKFCRLLRLLRG